MSQTVFVAMSGGVDSSVSAALLQRQGFKVVGVLMKNWSEKNSHSSHPELVSGSFCSAEQDFADMRAVCQHLGIPYYTFNFEAEYKKQVLDYFFAEYKTGRTPNPDVMCNKEIKFGLFLKKSLALGADFIATGHYARKRAMTNSKCQIPNGESPRNRGGIKKSDSSRYRGDTLVHQLLKGVDGVKDQTYFLYNLTQAQLAKTLFPIGQYPKKRVRALARQFKLPTADKPDSQGICFIGPVDVKQFLKTAITSKNGKIVNLDGKVVGEHEGAWFYTVGQRRVAGLSGQKDPLYVVSTDIKKNLVVVGPDSATYGRGVILEDLHLIDPKYFVRHPEFISGSHLIGKIPKQVRNDGVGGLSAKPRYGPDIYAGTLDKKGKEWHFVFHNPVRALTPGQSLVLYDGSICIGGGIIRKVAKSRK